MTPCETGPRAVLGVVDDEQADDVELVAVVRGDDQRVEAQGQVGSVRGGCS